MVPMPRLHRELWDEGVGRCKAFPPPLLARMRKSPSDHWRYPPSLNLIVGVERSKFFA